MAEIRKIFCEAFQDNKCILAAGLTEYDDGKFEVKQNGSSIYKGRNRKRAFNVYDNLCFSIQNAANKAGMVFKEHFQ